MMGVAGAIAGGVALAHLLSKRRRPVSSESAQQYEECVFDEVNRARSMHGLPPVDRDSELDAMGHRYASLMKRTGKFAHQLDGRSVGQRLDHYGLDYQRAAENLQRNDFDDCVSGCMETVWGPGGWMKSRKGHREAMLDPRYDRAGLGVEDDGRSWHVAMYFRNA